MVNAAAISKEEIIQILGQISDPEIPAVNIIEMGMVREVELEDNRVRIIITPTYSGCPAMNQITADIKRAIESEGIYNAEIITRLSPAWTTDWMSDATKEKLRRSGIAPPQSRSGSLDPNNLFNILKVPDKIICPFCNSSDTKMLSEFGSTACKSLHYCNNCLQAFDHFKCH